MPNERLTKSFIDSLDFSTNGKPIFFWDSNLKGYGLKVTPQKKIFIVQARVSGKLRRVTLGAYGAITPNQAKDMAKAELAKLTQGIDPSVERKKHEAQSVTLEQVVRSYFEAKTLKPHSIKGINTHLDFNFKEWKKTPLAVLTRAYVKDKFMEISNRSPAQANQAMRVLRALWNYAVAEYRYPDDTTIFGDNPVNILSEQGLWNTIQPRNSKIPIDKVGLAWNVLQSLKNSPILTPAGDTLIDATAFIFLTGCRLDEASSLTWDRINTDEGWWHLDDPKNGRPITFPLSDIACKIIEKRPRENEFVFSSKGKHGHITEVRTPMEKISVAIKRKVTAHDLRRTFKSIAIENKIELWKTNLLTNHRESGVAIKHYVETESLDQYLRSEVNTIAEWIIEQAKIAKIDNIIPMSGRKQAS